MKWLILIVVVILAAPTIANRLTPTDEDSAGTGARKGGFIYRAVRRFGPRTVLVGGLLMLIAVAVLAFLLVRRF